MCRWILRCFLRHYTPSSQIQEINQPAVDFAISSLEDWDLPCHLLADILKQRQKERTTASSRPPSETLR